MDADFGRARRFGRDHREVLTCPVTTGLLASCQSIGSNSYHFLQADFPVLIRTMRIWTTSGSPTIRELPEKHQTLVVIHFELGLVNVHRSELNLLT